MERSIAGPSEVQKLYGAELPPSLRWGSTRRPNESLEEQASSKRFASKRHTLPDTKTEPLDSNSRPFKTGPVSFERVQRPYRESLVRRDKSPSFSLFRERPTYARYPGSQPIRTETRKDAATKVLIGKATDREPTPLVEGLRRRKTRYESEKTRIVANAFLERTAVGKRKKRQATVESVVDDEFKISEQSTEAGPTEVVSDRPDDRHEAIGGAPASSPVRPLTSDDEIGSAITQLERERKAKEAELRGSHRTTTSEVTPSAYDTVGDRVRRKRLVYPRISLEHIDIDTLRYYGLPWEYDIDPNWIIITKDLSRSDTEVLFEHTRRLRLAAEAPSFLPRSRSRSRSRERSRVDEDTVEIPEVTTYDFIASDETITSRPTRYDENVPFPRYATTFNRSPTRNRWKQSAVTWANRTAEPTFDNRYWYDRRPSDAAIYSKHRAKPPTRPVEAPFQALTLSEEDQGAASKESAAGKRFLNRVLRQNTLLTDAESKRLLTRVVHSCYGNVHASATDGNVNSTNLVAVPRDCTSYGDAMFYKLHFQQRFLDFEKFKEATIQRPELCRVRKIIEDHLNRVQELHEKLPRSGDTVRHMEAFCESTSVNNHNIVSACLPFLQLIEHGLDTSSSLDLRIFMPSLFHDPHASSRSDISDGLSDTMHPFRTLFQSLNPRSNRKRDLKQVVCHMLDPHDQRYLVLSQVWILIVNEELLITCSTISDAELYGELLRSPESIGRDKPTQGAINVRLKTADGKSWVFMHEDCPTYLAFASHFSNITLDFANDFAIYHDNTEVFPHQWSKLMSQAKKSTTYLELRERPRLTSSEPTLHPVDGPVSPFVKAMQDRLEIKILPCNLREGFASETESTNSSSDGDGRKAEELLGETEGTGKEGRPHEKDGLDCYNGLGRYGTAREDQIAGPADADDTSAKDGHQDDERSDGNGADDSSEVSQQSSDSGDGKIRTIPNFFAKADLLESLGIEFEEGEVQFELRDGITQEQFIDIIERNNFLRGDELRAIAGENLAFGLGRQDQRVITAPEAGRDLIETLNDTVLDKMRLESSSSASDDEYYDRCICITKAEFNDYLEKWKTSPASTIDDSPTPPNYMDWEDLLHFCEALGYQHKVETDYEDDSEVLVVPFEGFLYANLQNGLRGILRLFNSHETSSEGDEEQGGKLLTAVLVLMRQIHRTWEPQPRKSAAFGLRKLNDVFARLFNIVEELELYSVLHQDLASRGNFTRGEEVMCLKHLTVCMLKASKSISEIDANLPMLEAGIAARDAALIEMDAEDRKASDYSTVRRLAAELNSIPRRESAKWLTQSELDALFTSERTKGVEELQTLGWQDNFAEFVLQSEVLWEHVRSHAEDTWRSLRRAFRATLQNNISNDIKYKAAAFPTDTMMLLLPQIMWRPVVDGQAALEMYLHYMTDLESDILIGDSSLVHLERIPYLKYELNAFSQLQTEQLAVLDQMKGCILDSLSEDNGDDYDRMRKNPHPRKSLLPKLQEGIEIQNNLVQMLHGSLDDLQSEAQAQVSNVQDWRDNASVVFTVIATIFLPLSFVSGVFGMNTNDIRNMVPTQWAFWAAAIPFTILVILVTLYFVDVPPLWRWLERRKNQTAVRTSTSPQPGRQARGNLLAKLARSSEDTLVD